MAFPPIRHDRVCFDVKKVCGLQATLNPSRKQEAGACESSLAKKKNQLWRRKDLGRPEKRVRPQLKSGFLLQARSDGLKVSTR